MPNWCDNHIEITTSSDSIVKEITSAINSHSFLEYCAPFPLPEWDFWVAIDHWGTKWEIDPDQTEVSTESLDNGFTRISISTCTAWSPPLEALSNLLNKEGIESVECHYHESGMAFCGVWRNGVDEYLEYDREIISLPENEYLSEYWNLHEMFEMYDELEESLT